jgi:hydroxymethylpyrimidine/phosphomethylpyrimidine kinase
VLDAVRAAKTFVGAAIAAAPAVGHGHGPLEHFHRWRQAPAGARDHAV